MADDLVDAPRVAVVGLGTMGSAIAWLFARAGWQVRVCDVTSEATATGFARIVERAATDPTCEDMKAALARITPARDLEDALRTAHLAVEVVSEDAEVKRDVLAAMALVAPDDAILASNTSSFPIDQLAGYLPDWTRSRFLGMHFFNPAELVPGVEVIPHQRTDPTVVERSLTILREAGKQPAVVRSSPGFIANRLQFALFLEAVACVDEGLVTPEDLDTVVRSTFGFRLPAYGPFEVADMAGLDVYVNILGVLADGLGERFAAPTSLVEAVARGDRGLKSGRGYGEYPPERQRVLLETRDDRYRAIARAVD